MSDELLPRRHKDAQQADRQMDKKQIDKKTDRNIDRQTFRHRSTRIQTERKRELVVLVGVVEGKVLGYCCNYTAVTIVYLGFPCSLDASFDSV